MTNASDINEQIHSLRDSDNELREEERLNMVGVQQQQRCPFSGNATNRTVGENHHEQQHDAARMPYSFIPLRMGGNGGTHEPSSGSKSLVDNEVSYDGLLAMTTAFYELAFQDKTLDKFIRSHNDPHGERFAKWIHQKLTGSNVWDIDRMERNKEPVTVAGGRSAVVHDRSSAHAAAWYSPKRPMNEVGRHFKLDECRVWMRLHFWAMRKSGLVEKSPSFADYYVRFIGHFVSVYESAATQFARDSFRWSANQSNIETYINNGREMKDVLGKRCENAVADIPDNEAFDYDWPYTYSNESQ